MLEEGLLLDVKSDDAGRLIGRQGQTLSELQYITNRLIFHEDPNAPKVTVDVGALPHQARDALVKSATPPKSAPLGRCRRTRTAQCL